MLDFLIDLGFYGSRFFYTSGFSEMESPSSCLSWLSSSQDSDLVGPLNTWFDYYNRAPPSPTSFVETDPN